MKPDGYIRIDTKIDQAGLKTDLSQLSGALQGFGGMIAATFASVATAAVTKFAASCVDLASDLTEVQNVIDVTFGEATDKIENFAKTADKAFGLSELKAKQFTGTLGAMVKSMGFTEDAAADMATVIAGLAGDMASFYNLDAEDAFAKLRSGLSGETEPLKQLGINLSAANLEAFALSQGITKAYESMSEAEKVTLRYNYILTATADAQGDFSRTSDSLANQTRILELEFEKLQTSIGQALLPVVTGVLQGINGLIEGINNIGKATDAADALDAVAAKAEETESRTRAAGETASAYVDQLERMAEKGLDSAEAQAEYAGIVDKLNALVPTLNVTIDEQTGYITQSTAALRDNVNAWKENAMAQALQERYKDTIKAYADAQAEVTENEIKLEQQQLHTADVAAQLDVVYRQLADSLGYTGQQKEDFVASMQASQGSYQLQIEQLAAMGASTDLLGADFANLKIELGASAAEERKLAGDIAHGQEKMAEYADEVKVAEEASKRILGTTKELTPVVQKHTASVEELAGETETLTGKTDLYKKALQEQTDAGTLSLGTVQALIAAGYQEAIQVDETTGAVTINKEAFLKLANAQYDALLAKAEYARTDLVGKIDAERAAVERLATADYAAAEAVLMLIGAQEKDVLAYDAQIAALKAAKSEIGKYAASVTSGAGSAGSAVDKAAQAFKDAVEDIDRALELGEITQEEYWDRYAELMRVNLKEGTDAWEDANYELLRGRKALNEELEAENERTVKEATDALQDVVDEYQSAVSDIERKVDTLAAKISAVDLAKEIKNKDGTTSIEFLDLGNLEKGTAQIETLTEKVQQLKDLGASESLLAAVSELDTQTAIGYAEFLIGLGSEGFKAYQEAWNERERAAKAAAQLFYQDELDSLKTEFTDKLVQKISDMKEAGYAIGLDTAKAIAAGLLAGSLDIQAAIATILTGLTLSTGASTGGAGTPTTGDLPHLAQGAVIPPNREFVAVLGDQKSGTNIEAPIDLIRAAVQEALAGAGPQGPVEVTITYTGELAAIGEALEPHVTVAQKRKGPRITSGGRR